MSRDLAATRRAANKIAFIDRSASNTGNGRGRIVARSVLRDERPVKAMRGANGGTTAGQGRLDLSSRARDGGLGRKIEAFLPAFHPVYSTKLLNT